MNKALPLFDATGSSVMFPDSLATECALSDSRLKEQKDTISVIHEAGKWLNEKNNPYETFVTHSTLI